MRIGCDLPHAPPIRRQPVVLIDGPVAEDDEPCAPELEVLVLVPELFDEAVLDGLDRVEEFVELAALGLDPWHVYDDVGVCEFRHVVVSCVYALRYFFGFLPAFDVAEVTDLSHPRQCEGSLSIVPDRVVQEMAEASVECERVYAPLPSVAVHPRSDA